MISCQLIVISDLILLLRLFEIAIMMTDCFGQ